jgi:hypothetical protein
MPFTPAQLNLQPPSALRGGTANDSADWLCNSTQPITPRSTRPVAQPSDNESIHDWQPWQVGTSSGSRIRRTKHQTERFGRDFPSWVVLAYTPPSMVHPQHPLLRTAPHSHLSIHCGDPDPSMRNALPCARTRSSRARGTRAKLTASHPCAKLARWAASPMASAAGGGVLSR